MLSTHPLLKTGYAGNYQLPVQALPASEKFKNKSENGYSEWEKQCLDALEAIAYQQYIHNEKYHINERIVNGEFITNDYFDCDDEDGFVSTLDELIKQGKIPKFIKNYNIVGKVIDVLCSIFDEFPDVFHIVGHGETFQSEKDREQTKLLQEWFLAKLEESIDKMMPEKSEEVSDEEYQQQRDSLKQFMTPSDIGSYMKSWRHDYELWAEYKALDLKYKYNTEKLKRTEYRDFIINGLRFRHFLVTNYGLEMFTEDPRYVFYQKSKDIEYVQDGDYVGTIKSLTPQRLIDKYSKILSSEQISKINEVYTNFNSGETTNPAKDLFGNTINYIGINNVPYNTNLPFKNEWLNKAAPALGMNKTDYNPFDLSDISVHNINSSEFIETVAYWKTQEKVYTLNWINPETQIQEIIEVDEEFVFPSYIKKVKNKAIVGEIEFNTAIENWNTVIAKGVKIRLPNSEAFYLLTGYCEYQKTSPNTIIPKLPIFGQVANNRSVIVRGIVDKLKPYQFLNNVAMNKAAKFQERGYLPFIAMDMKIMPKYKDWGHSEDEQEATLAKWLGLGEDLGATVIDTSMTNTMGESAAGGQFPRVIDMDLTPRIIQQLQIAQSIVAMGYQEIGISPELLGQTKSRDTATGINLGVSQSQHAISRWATLFLECEREMLQYSIEVCQWLEAEKKEISVEYVNSDYTKGILKFANTNFNLFDWRIYIVNSQEELRRKKLFEDLALTNTIQAKVSDKLKMMDKLTPSEKIVKIIEESERQAEQQQQKMYELEQQKIAAASESEKAKLEQEAEHFKIKLASEERQAWIKSRGYLNEGEQDIDRNKIPDAFEYEKYTTQSQRELDKLGISRDKLQLDREERAHRQAIEEAKLKLEDKKLNIKEKEIEQSAINAKYNDLGKYKK